MKRKKQRALMLRGLIIAWFIRARRLAFLPTVASHVHPVPQVHLVH